MLRTRLITAAILIPVAAGLIYVGRWPFLLLVGVLLTLAEVEFCQLMVRAAFQPNVFFGLGVLWIWLIDAQLESVGLLEPGLAALVLGAMAWQLTHRQGSPVASWALTVTGGLYLGLCGASLIKLRALPPDGLWWTLTVVASIMIADTGAFFIGRMWGRRKMAPTLSPRKTWEGYAAGILVGTAAAALLPMVWRLWAGPQSGLSVGRSLLLGLIIAVVAPVGDLGVSMIKRYVGAKDSGNVIPGHGGALDRVDSILWAAVIGYYFVLWFVPR